LLTIGGFSKIVWGPERTEPPSPETVRGGFTQFLE
jgi:hypothetical protein